MEGTPWWPWGRVAVSGASMEPTFRDGDWLMVRWGAAARSGDVVVARHPARPDLLLIKRAVETVDDGWWLEGDNPAASDDSRLFGAVPRDEVLGRVIARWWPLPVARPAHRPYGPSSVDP